MSSWYYDLQLEFSSAAIAVCVEFAARLRAIRWSLFTSRWVSAPGMSPATGPIRGLKTLKQRNLPFCKTWLTVANHKIRLGLLSIDERGAIMEMARPRAG
jgi:hypothetical protein